MARSPRENLYPTLCTSRGRVLYRWPSCSIEREARRCALFSLDVSKQVGWHRNRGRWIEPGRPSYPVASGGPSYRMADDAESYSEEWRSIYVGTTRRRRSFIGRTPSSRRRRAVLPGWLSKGRPEDPTRGVRQNRRSARTAGRGRRPHCRYRAGRPAPRGSAVRVPGDRDPGGRESRRPVGGRPRRRRELQDRRDVRGLRSGRAG